MTDERLRSITKDVVCNYHWTDWDLITITQNLLTRLEVKDFQTDFDSMELATQVIDDGLIYDDDLWVVIHHYCRPFECSFDVAYEAYLTDLIYIIDEIGEHEEWTLED